MESLKKLIEYEELKEIAPVTGITYGPIQSRRLGLSLGVNLLGSENKICNFNCPYCELGFTNLKMSEIKKIKTYPSLDALDKSVRQHLLILLRQKTKIDSITLSGNGEPTLFSDFSGAVDILINIKNDLYPQSKLVVLTNGSTLDNSKIMRALNRLDERIVKLDAGNDSMLKKIDAPVVRMTVGKLIQGVKKLKDVVLQSFFVQGFIDNTIASEVEEWIEVVGIIKPKQVHIYSLDRVPPTAGLKQVPAQRLKEIAMALQKRTGIKGTVFS